MDFLRQIVSGPKKRYRQKGYNLDLTYITDNIIAMAFPASGIQKMYRNSIDEVAQFLAKQHFNAYITINLSGRSIEEQKLDNVISYDWEDHKNPSIDVLFDICYKVTRFLRQDSKRVAVFHCNHGKGRTGTSICCLFLYLKIVSTPEQAMKFYSAKRFQVEGLGVTQPCQIEYIRYFHKLLSEKLYYPQIVALKEVKFIGKMQLENAYIKLKNMVDGKTIISTRQKQTNTFIVSKDNEYCVQIGQSLYCVGDLIIELKQSNVIKSKVCGSYSFNTAFIPETMELNARLDQLSPQGTKKSGKFSQGFVLYLKFKIKKCDCGQQPSFNQRCKYCKDMLFQQKEKWSLIQHSIEFQQKLDSEYQIRKHSQTI